MIEAMTCGLPTFATCNGGPSEIIKNGKSGFHIDPYHGAAVSVLAGLGICVLMAGLVVLPVQHPWTLGRGDGVSSCCHLMGFNWQAPCLCT